MHIQLPYKSRYLAKRLDFSKSKQIMFQQRYFIFNCKFKMEQLQRLKLKIYSQIFVEHKISWDEKIQKVYEAIIQQINQFINILHWNNIRFYDINKTMFLCCFKGKPKNNSISKSSKYFDDINLRLTSDEIDMLQLIYNDLSERHVDNKIDEENFFLFFHLNGMWGQMLFQSFDLDETQLLNFQQFVHGISKYIKANETEKILVLFNFLQGSSYEGIDYQSFIKMLYNYPKQNLKNMLNNKEFFENQIMSHVKNLNDHQFENSKKSQSKMKPKTRFQIQYEQSSQNLQKAQSKNQESHFEKAYKNLIKYKDPGTSLQFKIQNKTYSIKSVNINKLIKRFAMKIYQDYKVDLVKGKLNLQQFKDWITKHPELYKSYYDSFQNYIWETKNNKPLYTTTPSQIQSQAKLIIKDKVQNIYLILIQTTIVICSDETKEIAQGIICLQGLRVDPTQHQDKFGILISHRDGLYKQKKIVFKSKQLQQKWLQSLALFKGQSIQQKYNFIDKIGTGKFSIVYKCIKNNPKKHSNQKQQQYAVKVMQTYKLAPEQRNYIAHESGIMKILNHPNIIKLIESIQTKTHLYIVTQLAKGVDLFDYITMSTNYVRQYEAALIIGQIIQAVKYLHSLGLIHRDLKPENIMVILKDANNFDEIQRIKLIDFGFSDYVQTIKENKKLQVVGTPNYLAPETLAFGDINYKIDNFAIGVIMYFLLRGRLPFDSEFGEDIIQKTKNCEYEIDDYVWGTVSNAAKDLIKKFLTKTPQQRISLQDALDHEWFTIQDKEQKKKKIKNPFAF